jgi:hypothetical protein
MSWQVTNVMLTSAKGMKNALLHIFMRFSSTRHRIFAAAIFPDSPAQGLHIHVSGMNFGQLFSFRCLTLPSLFFTKRLFFRVGRWPGNPSG